MGKFFKENWLYIVLPILLVVVGVVVLVFMAESDPASGFTYNL